MSVLVNKDSKKAQALILKLSDMMRYSIYEGQKDRVTLQQELDYLKNYITLQEIRYHKKSDVQFNTEVENPDAKIMPLLFIILVENAFKHGVSQEINQASIALSIATTDKEILFKLTNSKPKGVVEVLGANKKSIGMQNTEKQLDLLYPNNGYELRVENTATTYNLELKLPLHEKV